MKEQTYGWYPSAKNVYEDRRLDTLTPYELEALYRYRESKYYKAPITPPDQRPSSSRPKSSASQASSKSAKSDHDLQTQLKLRIQSAPIHTLYKPPPRLNLPTPQQCWSTHVPETEITVLPPQPSPAPSVTLKMSREPTPQSVVSGYGPAPQSGSLEKEQVPRSPAVIQEEIQRPSAPTPPVHSPTTAMQKKVRVQSAKFRRQTPTTPQRPAKSAGPVRPSPIPAYQTPTPPLQTYHDSYESFLSHPPNFDCSWPQPSAINIDDIPAPDSIQIAERPLSGRISIARQAPTMYDRPQSSKRATPTQRQSPSITGRPPSGKKTPLCIRPMAPSPYKMEQRLEEDENLERSATPDYDAELKKHGWMMEVHGDPLKLKKVSKRLPYTVKVDEPETERDPPKVHMENLETFFLNTIPRRPMAFTIDKEWISEIIHKKRLEMQKKHGINYSWKKFSFVY